MVKPSLLRVPVDAVGVPNGLGDDPIVAMMRAVALVFSNLRESLPNNCVRDADNASSSPHIPAPPFLRTRTRRFHARPTLLALARECCRDLPCGTRDCQHYAHCANDFSSQPICEDAMALECDLHRIGRPRRTCYPLSDVYIGGAGKERVRDDRGKAGAICGAG